jgi:hypothetical protein
METTEENCKKICFYRICRDCEEIFPAAVMQTKNGKAISYCKECRSIQGRIKTFNEAWNRKIDPESMAPHWLLIDRDADGNAFLTYDSWHEFEMPLLSKHQETRWIIDVFLREYGFLYRYIDWAFDYFKADTKSTTTRKIPDLQRLRYALRPSNARKTERSGRVSNPLLGDWLV